MWCRLTLRSRRRSAGARVSSPRLFARQIALFEENVLSRCRDSRVLLLIEDDFRLRRWTRALVSVRSRAAAGVAARTSAAGAGTSPTRLVATLLSIPIEMYVHVRLLLLTLHIVFSQTLFLILFTGWSCWTERRN